MRAADGRRLYEEQQVWAAHRSKQGTRLRGKEKAPLTADEEAIVQRARGTQLRPATERQAGHRPAAVQAADARVKRTITNQAHSMQAAHSMPYPQADARTLQMLGTIDALLKAPPRPPRWALLRILSLLEEYRERSQYGGEGFASAPRAQQRNLSEAVRQHGARGGRESNETAARAVARRVRDQMQGSLPEDVQRRTAWELLAPDLAPSDHRRVQEERDVRGRNRLSVGIG